MTASRLPDTCDVLIAGARCAGASTALLLARAGARVLVVDPLPEGRDTVSTHALMRGGVEQLHRWGLLDALRAGGTPPVRTTTFDYGDEVVSISIAPRGGVDALYAPRRTVLDPLLERAARAAGAVVERGWAVADVVRGAGGRVEGAVMNGPGGARRTVRADLVVGADGARSRVARRVGAPVLRAGRHATAVVYGYFADVGEAGYRWIFRPGFGAGAIPTDGGETCVFVSMPPGDLAARGEGGLLRLFRERLARAVPEWAARIEGVEPAVVKGFAGLPGHLRRAVGPGWALVGDAGCFRDPLTAHGITDALRDAELLARAALRGDGAAFGDYAAARDRAAIPLFQVTDAIASLAWTMDEVKQLHHELARTMKVGVEVLRERVAA